MNKSLLRDKHGLNMSELWTGNIESFKKCIGCNIAREKEDADLLKCWDFNQCSSENRNHCAVYRSGMGRQCYLYHDIQQGCPGNNDEPCSECALDEKIIS